MTTQPAFKEPKPETEFPLDWKYVQSHEGIYATQGGNQRLVTIKHPATSQKVTLWVASNCYQIQPANPKAQRVRKFRRTDETLVIGFAPK